MKPKFLFTAPFDQFESPFVSQANFVDGQMDGEWTIADARGRMCSRVTLKNGKRNGPATLWLPDGRVFRESHFVNGLPSGELRELGPDGKLTTVATYVDGRQVVNNVTYFPESEDKHIEATCVAAVVSLRVPDDYVQLRFAQYAVRTKTARMAPGGRGTPMGSFNARVITRTTASPACLPGGMRTERLPPKDRLWTGSRRARGPGGTPTGRRPPRPNSAPIRPSVRRAAGQTIRRNADFCVVYAKGADCRDKKISAIILNSLIWPTTTQLRIYGVSGRWVK